MSELTPTAEETRLFASHQQFYVQDREPRGAPDDPSFWTEEASDSRLAVGDGLVAIGTGSYGFVKVRVEHHHCEPDLDLSQWDHATECDLNVQSEMILVMGCLSVSGLFFSVQPGHYRVRALHAKLAESEQEVPAGWAGEFRDWYLVQFWKARPSCPRILKRWLSQSR